MPVPIPVINFFHMFAYAWEEFRPGRLTSLQASSLEAPIDFLASMLCETVQDIFRDSLAKRHHERTDRMRAVRGKIDVTRSVLLPDFDTGTLICRYPSLEVNRVENQILKTTLKSIIANRLIGSKTREKATVLFNKLHEVSDTPVSKRIFSSVRLDRTMKRYRFPLVLCELIFDHMFVSEDDGSKWFYDYTNDEVAMRRLFEAFVRNFLKQKLDSRLSIGAKRFPPTNLRVNRSSRSLIPTMKTDVSILSDGNELIIDTKYTPTIFKKSYGKEKIRTEHFYQIQAYVMHKSKLRENLAVSGMLLYPRSDREVRLSLSTCDHKFHVCTLDLNMEWQLVERELLHLVNSRIN